MTLIANRLAAGLDTICYDLGLGQPLDDADYQLRGRWWFWLSRLATLRPHLVLQGADGVYMKRWWLLPKNRWCNLYLHCFLGPDDSELLHDHPYDNVSLILRGGYREKVLGPEVREEIALESDRVALLPQVLIERTVGDVVLRRAGSPHSIDSLLSVPTWSLFLTGPAVRLWGFHTTTGWRFWKTHLGVGASA